MLELVGIEFHPGEAPGGSALLLFSQGEALRLDVECLECELTDLGTDDLGASERRRSRRRTGGEERLWRRDEQRPGWCHHRSEPTPRPSE